MHGVKSKALLKADKCLLMQPELINIAGKSPALLLQQIHYWIANEQVKGKVHQGKKWIANSCEAWSTDIKAISRSTVVRSIKTLRDLGIICVEKLSDYKNNRTNWYTINYDRISELLDTESSFNLADAIVVQDEVLVPVPVPDRLKVSSRNAQSEPMYNDKKTNKETLIYLNKSDISKISKNNFGNLEKPLSQQMVDIWNETMNPNIKSELTKNRCRSLIAALKLKFSNNIQEWKQYCIQIASSDFLMGKMSNGFKIALDTALKFDFIQKIFEKQFGVKDTQVFICSNESVIEEIISQESSPEIKTIRLKIYHKLGHSTYVSWFKDLKMTKTLDALEIIADSIFKRDWISNNFRSEIDSLISIPTKILVN